MDKYCAIGLMSGTSLDGLDIAYCEFLKENDRWTFEIKNAETVSYSTELAQELAKSTLLDALQLSLLHKRLGRLMGQEVKRFCQEHHLKPDFVSSHGHTVFHQPQHGLTLQIGDGFELMVNSGLPVINDFRSLDVALGGQGAPLVPIGDQLLFQDYDYCLNLGGIANISFVKNRQRIAFDVCAANMVLNTLANLLGKPYDDEGSIARTGVKDEKLFERLNKLDFHQQAAPKSLGLEWVREYIFPLLDQSSTSIENKLCTFSHHIAYQIGQIDRHTKGSMLVTGGGAYNQFLIELIQAELAPACKVAVPDHTTIQFKEALIFAFLGVLRMRGEVNTLASVTGASKDSSGGVLYRI